MRSLIALVLLGLATAPPAASAQSATYDIPAHVTRVDGSAVLERRAEGEPLEINLTLVEGDRVRTQNGRVEILFADGTLLHLDRHTIIDFQRGDFVRVMEGRARWLIARGTDRADTARGNVVRVDTPAATLELEPGGDYRVAVAPNGDAELMVLRGAGALLNDQGDRELRAGERAVAAVGRAPSQAFYANAAAWDDFDRWSDARRRDHAATVSLRYLPNELHPYGSVFDSYGSWRPHPSHGYVWYPVAAAGWQPYSHGRWRSYDRYGWTWIDNDPWGWPTHHFGRWGFSTGVWFWIPGRTWGPAWVSWASSRGYVGWSPLGWDNRPIINITNVNVYNASGGYPWCGWTFIRERSFGGRPHPADVFIGTGISVVARNGIVPVAVSPVGPRRAVPRNGVAGGTAVPRGTAVARPGGEQGAPGGLTDVPTARPRRIPTDTIRSVPRSTGSEGSAGSVPRSGSTGSGSEGSARTARPRGGDNPPAAVPSTSAPAPAPAAGRPVRRSGGGESPSASSYPYAVGAPAPRVRDREPSNAPSAAPSAPAYEPRARQREPRGSDVTPAPSYPAAAPARAAVPRRSSDGGVERPQSRPPAGEPREAPPARSRGAEPRSGGVERSERRPAPTPPPATAPARRRGGG